MTSLRTSIIPDAQFVAALKNIDAEAVYFDAKTLGLYATDASLYQLQPIGVFVPKNEADLVAAVKLCYKYKIPILPRGSGTSLAGQTVNHALVIDFTRHFDQILSVDPIQKYAVVQPGVVRDTLNNKLKVHGLHYAPDPATSSRATVGGMIANNSSGTKSIKYGKSIDHILGLRVLLTDGTILDLKETTPAQYEAKCALPGREGQIYQDFRKVIYDHAEAIEAAFPKVMRRVQGYPLDEYIGTDHWNLAKIFSGSEGSLGIILDCTINLEPIASHKAAFTVHYHDRMEAIRDVSHMIQFEPAAVEMLDYNVFDRSKENHSLAPLHRKLIVDDPQATMTVEFFCLSQTELDDRIARFTTWLQTLSKAYAYPLLTTAKDLDDAWTLRKNGLGLLMGDPAGRKPVPFIEDMAIGHEHLAEYIETVLKICADRGVETILYAHASVGVLHVRPALDMNVQADIELMKDISEEVFKLVKKYKGSWSGEHGDGRDRGPRLRDFFGEEVYECLIAVKNIFDPDRLMNPEIIIDTPPMDQNMRIDASYQTKAYDYVYHYRHDHSFEGLIHNCSGVGVCRNHNGGTMCPSFRATSQEEDSTRGRANAIRLAISGQMGFESLSDPKVLETLDLCLSCKACKSECPSNVDMAKLKSEVWQHKYSHGKITMRERLIDWNAAMVKTIAGKWFTRWVNALQVTGIFRWLMDKTVGVDKRRVLPSYATQTLSQWYKSHFTPRGEGQKVVLFADTYINYHDTDMGRAAIHLLDSCGYQVILADVGCCQRPRVSNGFLYHAKRDGLTVAKALDAYLAAGIPILVCEPSCTTALTDDIPDLIDDASLGQRLKHGVYAIDDWLPRQVKEGKLDGKFVPKHNKILIHGHCHQKASFGTRGMHDSLQGSDFSECDSGCCGMAGSFGYEKEHYDLSVKIAQKVLLPAIEKSEKNTAIVANGFSCRHQIKDLSTRQAIHWVQAVRWQTTQS
jgi:FAD/FMN-containing dehydrogenase/Fe-S oxidoreductase